MAPAYRLLTSDACPGPEPGAARLLRTRRGL